MAELKLGTTIGGFRQIYEGMYKPQLIDKLTITKGTTTWRYAYVGQDNISLELGSSGLAGGIKLNSYVSGNFSYIRSADGQLQFDTTNGTYWFNQDTSSNGGIDGILYICNQQGNTGIKLDSQGTSTFAGGLSVSGTISEGGTALSSKYLGISQTAQQATKLQTQRTINGVSFDGSGNITITAACPQTLTLATSGVGISGSTTYNGGTQTTFTVTSNATSQNTQSTIVARD